MTIAGQKKPSATGLDKMEKVLGRIILRLTLATSGLDPALDPHLRTLRNAVRKGVRPESLPLLIDISEKLVRAEGEMETASAPGADNQLLSRLISFLSLKNSQLSRFLALGEKIDTAADANDADIGEFISLLTTRPTQQKKGGFFSKLFAGKSTASQEAGDPNETLRCLLEKTDWPDQIAQDIQSFISELGTTDIESQWEDILRRLVLLLSSTLGNIRSEIRATEGFLTELHSRLGEIDSHINFGKERRSQSLEGGEALGKGINQEVERIRHGVQVATSAEQVRAGIETHLDRITSSVEAFVISEAARHKEAESSEARLKSELDSVESEARELRRKVVEAHRQAATDSVTGLPNRMAYEERLAQEVARWKRFGEPLCMLVWDVDDFKAINDRFGHQSGDKALRVIAQLLQKQLRETDFVARFGGEEFAMLLAGSSKDDAIKLANTIRSAISGSGFHSGGGKVPVTISCGIGSFQDEDTPEEVFSRADNALYEAKRAGKDRVVAL